MRSYSKLRLIAVALFLSSFATFSCSTDDVKYTLNYSNLYSRITFLPLKFIDELSNADKTWFSAHTFDLQWRIIIEKTSAPLDTSQKEKVKNRLTSMLKTFNYVVNTKQFSESLSALDGGDYLTSSNKSLGSPRSIAVLLALRGLNSRHFNTGELKFILNDNENRGVTDGKAILDSDNDDVSGNLILDKGSWDFWNSRGINIAVARLKVDYLKYQTVSNSNYFYSCENETVYEGVFSYNDFCKVLLQTIFDWENMDTDKSLLNAVANIISELTCGFKKNVNEGKNPPFEGVNFDSLKLLGFSTI